MLNRRFVTTLATSAWLTGLYLLYAHFVSPLIEPAQLATNGLNTTQTFVIAEREKVDSEHHSVAKSFLPEQDWAKEADNQYRVGDLFLYAMQVEQLSDRAEIRFRPFAMVWRNPKAQPGEPPLRVTAESAVIRFQAAAGADLPPSSKHSLGSLEGSGRPVFGALEGNVEIEGPNGLKITGKGFTFDESALRLWSDSDILFHYGPHRATGNGLQVDFLPATETAANPDMPRLAGLRSVSLLRQVVLDLAGDAKPSTQRGRKSTLKPLDQLHVTSEGRLQYDIESSLVTIEQNVRAAHPLPGATREGLNCDLLTLVLSSETTRSQIHPDASHSKIELTSNEAESNGTQDHPRGMTVPEEDLDLPRRDNPFASWLPKHLELEKFLADGSGKRRVELYSPQRQLHGNTGQIEYDLKQRTVVLRDPVSVDIKQSQHELHAPEILLRFADNQKDVEYAIARGAGNALSRLQDGRVVTANWKKQLIKSADPRSDLELVELQGQASVALDTEYHFSGDALRIWMSPFVKAGNAATRDPGDEAPMPTIQRVAGVGQVVLKSPQATTQNEWIDVRFLSQELPPQEPDETESLFGLNAGGQPAPHARGKRNQPAMAAKPPMNLKSQRLSATVLRDPAQASRMVLAELTVEGAIEITQSLSAKELQPPIRMLGNKLTVRNVSPTQQIVHLTGTAATPDRRPISAQIRSGESRIEGPSISLDREQNTLEVTGAGLLEYPVKTSLEGQPLDRPQLLHVQWAESLKFDGLTADFYEKVEASVDQTKMHCNAMHVTLAKPIRFDGPNLKNLKSENVQLARIFCENRVELVTCEYKHNVVVSRGSGRLGQFVIDNVSGKTEATGPGYFVRWTLEQQRREPKAGTNRRTKKAIQRPAPAGWTYSRIDFQGHMKGNIQDRTATFEDHVEMVYGPVPHATDLIDPDTLPEGGAAMTCDSLKVSQFAENAAQSPHLRFSAEGNTKLELVYQSKQMYMMADEVKYDESKDGYFLRSNGDRKVVICKEPTSDNLDFTSRCAGVFICPSQSILKMFDGNTIGLQQ